MVALSNLEFAHDSFIFKMHEVHRDLSVGLSNRFPRHFRNKTDFLVEAIASLPKLRTEPVFQTGELNTVWLQYQLDELYGIRSILAHGSISFSESTPDRITWTFRRVVPKEKKTWTQEAVKISNGYLASVHLSGTVLSRYLTRLTLCLEGTSCWEKDYQMDKEIRENRILLSEIAATGVLEGRGGWINAFPPFGPVE